jgi:hypothetical protein
MCNSITISDISGHLNFFASIKDASVALLGDQFKDKSNEACRIAVKRFASSKGLTVTETAANQVQSLSSVSRELIDESAFIRAFGY